VFRTEFLRLGKPFTSAAKAGQSASLDRSAGSAAPPKTENLTLGFRQNTLSPRWGFSVFDSFPRLAPWAAFLRRFAALYCYLDSGSTLRRSAAGRARRPSSIYFYSRLGSGGFKNRTESALVAQSGPFYLMIQAGLRHLVGRQRQRLKPRRLRGLRHD